MAPYTGTKHALEAIFDGFRWELRQFGIESSLIEPGSFQSELSRDFYTNQELLDRNRTIDDQSYFLQASKYYSLRKKILKQLPPADPVWEAVETALLSKFPPSRTTVGWDAVAAYGAWMVPDRFRDMISALFWKFL